MFRLVDFFIRFWQQANKLWPHKHTLIHQAAKYTLAVLKGKTFSLGGFEGGVYSALCRMQFVLCLFKQYDLSGGSFNVNCAHNKCSSRQSISEIAWSRTTRYTDRGFYYFVHPILINRVRLHDREEKDFMFKVQIPTDKSSKCIAGPSLGVLNKLAAVNVPECNFSIRLAALETDVTVVNST